MATGKKDEQIDNKIYKKKEFHLKNSEFRSVSCCVLSRISMLLTKTTEFQTFNYYLLDIHICEIVG